VHLGISRAEFQVLEKAKALGLPAYRMVFEPQPEGTIYTTACAAD